MKSLSTKKNIPITGGQHQHNPLWSLQNELNKAIGEVYGWFEPFNFPAERFENIKLVPSIDIVDDKHQFKVETEMPGIGQEDISVSIDNGILTIKGEKSKSRQDEDKSYMTREITYGSYERCIALPDNVDTEKAQASFKKGMLWVRLPKKPESDKTSRSLKVEFV